jgi:flagellar protein FliL
VYIAKEQGMAKEDELELDVQTAKPSGKGKLIMLVAAVVLLLTGSVIGVLYFMGMLGAGSSDQDKPAAEQPAAKKAFSIKPTFYLNLQPAFVVNFEDSSHASYLQVDMQVMARSKELLDIVSKNMPVIRNNILLILSAQKYEQVSTRAGKEQLQKTILEAIQKVVSDSQQASHAAESKDKQDKSAAAQAADNIEQVYFTSFIMQ